MPDGYLNDEVGRGVVKKEGGRMCVEGPWERKKVSLNGSRRGEVQRHLGGGVWIGPGQPSAASLSLPASPPKAKN